MTEKTRVAKIIYCSRACPASINEGLRELHRTPEIYDCFAPDNPVATAQILRLQFDYPRFGFVNNDG